MILIEKQIADIFKRTVEALYGEQELRAIEITMATNEKFGDFQTNFAMVNSKVLKSNPRAIAENVVNTVRLDADTIIILNVEDDVIISAREILFYGGKLTYDSVIELKKGGSIRFFENFSIQGLSGDAIIKLENGKEIRLFDVKTKKIKDLADEFVPDKDNYGKDATMVGHGFTITYAMLDNLSLKPAKKQKKNWASKFGFSKK